MSSKSGNSLFNRRGRSHTIVIAQGDRVRHWTLPSWALGTGVGVAAIAICGGIAASIFSLSSDRVIQFMLDREMRATNVYEDRINGLRQELDRVTTRQHVDREEIGRQVESLLSQQERIAGRFDRLEPLLDQAAVHGLTVPVAKPPIPDDRPGKADASMLGLRSELRSGAAPNAMDRIQSVVLPTIRATVGMVEEQQLAGLATLSRDAAEKVDRMTELLRPLGLAADATTGTGGPFVAAHVTDSFESQVDQLERMLDLMDDLRRSAKRLPLGDPQPNGTVTTSGFGVRTDPFLGRAALHTGVDFAGTIGTPVQATGAGRVISAGDQGGYGSAIEIDHGNGVSTRFAHLSRIDVSVGSQVAEGSIIGAIGSTGRSTGPHLHYEVRIRDEPVDPQRYIRAGHLWAKL